MNWDNTSFIMPYVEDSEGFAFSSLDEDTDTTESVEILPVLGLSGDEDEDISEGLPFLLERAHHTPVILRVEVPLPPVGTCSPLNAFRIQCKEFALTFPRTDTLPSVALARIMGKAELATLGVTMCVVVQEAHTLVLNTVHLHVWLFLDSPLRVMDHAFFDFIADKHGNYQAVRSRFKWLTYITKSPLHLAQFPDDFNLPDYIATLSAKRSSKSFIVSASIKSGRRDIYAISDAEPAFVMMHLRKVRDFINLCNDQDVVTVELVPFPLVYPADLPLLFACNEEIYQWVKESVVEDFNHPKLHLRIVGESGIHKTHFLTLLARFFHVWHAPYDDGIWMERFDDRLHQVVLLDEYKNQWKIRKINEFTDGAGYGCPQRNGLPFVHNVRVPCIMCTNYSWVDAYPKALGQDAMALSTCERRWKEVTIPHGQSLLSLCTLLESML